MYCDIFNLKKTLLKLYDDVCEISHESGRVDNLDVDGGNVWMNVKKVF